MNMAREYRGIIILTALALALAGGVYARGQYLLHYTPAAELPADFADLGWGAGVPTLLQALPTVRPLTVLFFAATVAVAALTGRAWAGKMTGMLTGTAALLSAPLLLNCLASPWRGALLLLWSVLLLWTARAEERRSAALAGGLLAGGLAGVNLLFVLPLVWLACRQPRGRRLLLLSAGAAAMVITLAVMPLVGHGLRAEVHDLLNGPAVAGIDNDLRWQVWRFTRADALFGAQLALHEWWRAVTASPWPTLTAWGGNALRLLGAAEGDDTYPWTVVRTYDWQLRLLPGWAVFWVLGALGWRSVTAEQRWQLLPFMVFPVLAGIFLSPTLWWRALLTVPLCYLAARGVLLVQAQEARALAWACVLLAMLAGHWLLPNVPSPSLWRGLALVAVHHAEPADGLRMAQARATRHPQDEEAWWLAHYAALRAGEPTLAAHCLVRAALATANAGRRAGYLTELRQIQTAILQ